MKISDLNFLVDQLTNSMEYFNKSEFVENLISNTKIEIDHLELIYDKYWKLNPLSRFEFTKSQWIEFINNLTNG